MKNKTLHHACVIFITSTLIFSSRAALAQIQFEDVTEGAGGFSQGERWGASWGDFNGDQRPDLFVNDHRGDPAALYVNNGDGTFMDVIYAFDRNRVLIDDPKQDAHGATFVDFDNDGDQDIFATHSANKIGRLFVNNDGVFTDQASNSDLTNDGTARLPTWLDYNDDGFLDVFFITSNSMKANVHDPDGSGGFIGDFDSVSTSNLGVSCSSGNYGQLMDVNNDGRLDFICGREGNFPAGVYSTHTIPFQNITSTIPNTASVVDTAVGDLDGNLQSDIIMARGRLRPTEALKVASKRIESWISGTSSSGKGFTFNAGDGELTFTVDAQYNDLLTRIKIGSGGFSPSSIPFTIDSADASTHGLSGSNSWGFYIGFDNSTQEWTVEMRASSSRRAYFQIDAENNVSDPVMMGLNNADLPITTRVMMNNAGGFQEQASSRGITGLRQCASVVTADFDNDGDLDIYKICRTGVSNIANILYENTGNGNFVEVANAGGAQGPIGAGLISGAGTAESVVTADYDLDGFVDLFVTNGMLMQPARAGGPDILFRNATNNGNHWVHIDLEGATSTTPYSGDSRDAIGAKVYVTAAGETQVHEQGHGYHRWSQNHKRVHFGLGSSTQFSVEVHWKNGNLDIFNNVAADQIYNIKQGAFSGDGVITTVTPGPVDYPPAPVTGDECGEPDYNANFDKAVFVWKDCSTNRWEVKAMAGGSAEDIVYAGSVSTDSGNLTNITPLSLQGNDVLNTVSPTLVEFVFNVSKASTDGFRFDAPGGATTQACLNFTQLPQGAPVLLGADTVYLGDSADLGTFALCSGPPQPADECGQPVFDKANESGLFIWKDCGIAGSESWHIRVTGGGNSPAISYGGLLAADQNFLSVTPFSFEGSDVLDNSDPMQVNYLMKVSGAGQDGIDFIFSNSTSVCFDPNVMPAGASVELGSGRHSLTTPVDLTTMASCSPPSEPLECGVPGFSAGSDKNIYIWKDCTGSGDWSMRATGGGDPNKQTYIGSISSSLGFSSVTPFSIEPSDTLDSSSDPNVIDFVLGMRNAGQDGVNFGIPAGSDTCFDATTVPAGTQVLLGGTQAPMSVPFDLITQGSCP